MGRFVNIKDLAHIKSITDIFDKRYNNLYTC